MEEPPPLCRWNSAGWPLSNAYAYRVKAGLPNVDPICPSGSLTGSKMRQENSRPRYGAGVDGMSSVPGLPFRKRVARRDTNLPVSSLMAVSGTYLFFSGTGSLYQPAVGFG